MDATRRAKMTTVHFRMDSKKKEWLRKAARAAGVPMTTFVADMIRQKLGQVEEKRKAIRPSPAPEKRSAS